MDPDSKEIANLLDENLYISGKDSKYGRVEWEYLQDSSGGGYTPNNPRIEFNITSALSKFHVYSESFLVLPVKCTSAAATDDSLIAVKASLLSLVSGLILTTTSGNGSIVSEADHGMSILNNLKLLLDSNTDFFENGGPELHFAGLDRSFALDQNADNAKSKIPIGAATTVIGKNRALTDRIQCFKNAATFAAGDPSFSFVAYIPLKFLHDFLSKCDWAMINVPLKMQFILAGTVGNVWQPFVTASQDAGFRPTAAGVNTAIADIAASGSPVVSVNKDAIEKGGTGVQFGTCRLYLKTVRPVGKMAEAITAKVKSGTFTKYIDYTTSELFWGPDIGLPAGNAPASQTSQITVSTVRPVRVWVLPTYTPLNGQNSISLSTNVFPYTMPGNVKFTDVNLTVDTTQLYDRNLETQYELYKQLQLQQHGSSNALSLGGHITYQDYINHMNPIVFDLTRMRDLDSNKAVSLMFKASVRSAVLPTIAVPVPPATIYKPLFLVERMRTAKFNINDGSSYVQVSDGITRDPKHTATS